MTDLVRYTVNLTKRSDAAQQLAHELTGDSKTDVTNRALQVYAYLLHIAKQEGAARVIHITDPDTPDAGPALLVL